MNLINISIKIADRDYPLKIKETDETKIRNAAAYINRQLKELMNKYDGRDMQDYMAMYLLIQMNENSSSPTSIDVSFSDSLSKINNDLDNLLKV
ncbi:MAG: Cell division protein ZapA [Bacteroidota bacterium]|jgi:cell division protein ZapA